jgi:hypothetical protein
LNIRLTVLVVETARLERRGVNDSYDANYSLPYDHLQYRPLSETAV